MNTQTDNRRVRMTKRMMKDALMKLNWYLTDIEVDGQKYTSTEQYIMYRKCLTL